LKSGQVVDEDLAVMHVVSFLCIDEERKDDLGVYRETVGDIVVIVAVLLS
jgi:hypothetical protein